MLFQAFPRSPERSSPSPKCETKACPLFLLSFANLPSWTLKRIKGLLHCHMYVKEILWMIWYSFCLPTSGLNSKYISNLRRGWFVWWAVSLAKACGCRGWLSWHIYNYCNPDPSDQGRRDCYQMSQQHITVCILSTSTHTYEYIYISIYTHTWNHIGRYRVGWCWLPQDFLKKKTISLHQDLQLSPFPPWDLALKQLSNLQNPYDIPPQWLVGRDPLINRKYTVYA